MFLRPVAQALLVGAIVSGAATVAAAQAVIGTPAHDTDKGAALMVEARKALGGEDKLAAIKRFEIKGSSKRVQGGQTLEGDTDIQVETPDKFRLDEEISIPGGAITITRTQALNGTNVWDLTEGGNLPGGFGGRGGGGRGGNFGGGGGQGGRLGGAIAGALGTDTAGGQQGQVDPARAAALVEQQRRARQTDLTRYLIAFLATTSEAPAWVGTAKTPKDETADVLEVTTADGTVTRLFLESTTHMPLMMTFSGPAPRPQGGGRGRGGNAGAGGGGNPDAAAGGGGGGGRRGGGDPAAAGAPQGAQPQGAPGAAPATGTDGGQGQGRRGNAQAQPATIEMYLSDYKVENGIKMPHVITREISGEIQEELTLKNFKFNPNFKSNTFTQPKP